MPELTLDPIFLNARIVAAYENLADVKQRLHRATEDKILWESAIATFKAQVIAGLEPGDSLGKNDAERAARLRKLLPTEHENLEVAEAAVRLETHNFALSQLNVDCLRARLRCAELAAGIDRQSREAH